MEIKQYFQGKHWEDLETDILNADHYSSLHFLTPEAYRFYLPAYMIVSIELGGTGSLIPDVVVSCLTCPTMKLEIERYKKSKKYAKHFPEYYEDRMPPSQNKIDEDRKRFLERNSKFSEKENEAIRVYLEFMQNEFPDDFDEDEAQVALNSYWQKKLED